MIICFCIVEMLNKAISGDIYGVTLHYQKIPSIVHSKLLAFYRIFDKLNSYIQKIDFKRPFFDQVAERALKASYRYYIQFQYHKKEFSLYYWRHNKTPRE